MQEIICKIKSNVMIADKTFEMKLKSNCAVDLRNLITGAGQFINIKLDGFFLRRPISICDWSKSEITIIYKVVGKGTEAMSKYKMGRELNVLVSLGNGFNTFKSGDRPLLVAGGVGVPPIYGLAKKLVGEGKSPIVAIGFNTAEEVFYTGQFEELGILPIVTTIDGTKGVTGFVTDVISELEYTFFYACGPEKMLEAIDRTVPSGIEGELSFEERMGCGFGTCMGCTCKTKYKDKRICADGPVLERSEIIW